MLFSCPVLGRLLAWQFLTSEPGLAHLFFLSTVLLPSPSLSAFSSRSSSKDYKHNVFIIFGSSFTQFESHPLQLVFNPFTAPACKISGLKDARTPLLKKSIFSSPVTHLLSVLCVLIKILSHASAKKKKKGRRIWNFALLLIVFNDVMAVKGLTVFPACVLLRHSFSVEQW